MNLDISPFTETARVSQIIAKNAGMTELQFFAKQIDLWKDSPQRKEQLAGELYYLGEHDILHRRRTVIGEDGNLVEVSNLPNNRIVDNQYAKMVDQKANYLLGKPLTLQCENKAYTNLLNGVFNNRFLRTFRRLGEDTLNGGIGWLYFYYDKSSKPAFRRLPSFQILPFWADDDHTELDAALRLYPVETWHGAVKTTVWHVELYKRDGIWRYIYNAGSLAPDSELGAHDPYFWKTDEKGTRAEEFNWVKIPLIPFKYNAAEMPLVRRVKSLQDGINAIMSDWENNMQEDARNTILVLTNYDGEDLGEFRRNLAAFGAVKVRDDGGVNTLQVEVNSENYKSILDVFKAKLIENARGFDAKDDRLGNNPNQMNIQSMYADIDLDANGMETEFQASFEELLWFVNQYFIQTGQGDFQTEKVTVVFNRDVLVNESESITNCKASVGILSDETIVTQHPWTTDVEKELQRIKKERQEQLDEAMEYQDAFGGGATSGEVERQ